MDLISFKTHHLNRRHFYDEIQLLLFSVFPCWKVSDHRKSGHWRISALFRFQIPTKDDANLVKGIYCFIQKIFASADYGFRKCFDSKLSDLDGFLFENVPCNHQSRICHLAVLPGSPTDHMVDLLKKILWFNILSHL